MKTLDSILEDMENRVRENHPVRVDQWLDGAVKINMLRGDLDNAIADYEADMAEKEAEFVEEGKSAAVAKILAKKYFDYRGFKKAEKKAKRIEEFLRLAKKRAVITTEFS